MIKGIPFDHLPFSVTTETDDPSLPFVVYNAHGFKCARFASEDVANDFVEEINGPEHVPSNDPELMQRDMRDSGVEHAQVEPVRQEESMPRGKAKKKKMASKKYGAAKEAVTKKRKKKKGSR